MAQHIAYHDDSHDHPSHCATSSQASAYHHACVMAHDLPKGVRMVLWAFPGSTLTWGAYPSTTARPRPAIPAVRIGEVRRKGTPTA